VGKAQTQKQKNEDALVKEIGNLKGP